MMTDFEKPYQSGIWEKQINKIIVRYSFDTCSKQTMKEHDMSKNDEHITKQHDGNSEWKVKRNENERHPSAN